VTERTKRGRQRPPAALPTDLGKEASRDISAALNVLLADMFVLYLKTKSFRAAFP
jgi:starvation-inducible DNA-binding protein